MNFHTSCLGDPSVVLARPVPRQKRLHHPGKTRFPNVSAHYRAKRRRSSADGQGEQRGNTHRSFFGTFASCELDSARRRFQLGWHT